MWCVCEFDILTRRLTAERSSGRSVLCTSNKYECAMNGVFIFVRAYTNEGISCIINSTEYDKHELRTENHTAFSLYWSFRWKRSTHKHRNFAYVNNVRVSNLLSIWNSNTGTWMTQCFAYNKNGWKLLGVLNILQFILSKTEQLKNVVAFLAFSRPADNRDGMRNQQSHRANIDGPPCLWFSCWPCNMQCRDWDACLGTGSICQNCSIEYQVTRRTNDVTSMLVFQLLDIRMVAALCDGCHFTISQSYATLMSCMSSTTPTTAQLRDNSFVFRHIVLSRSFLFSSRNFRCEMWRWTTRWHFCDEKIVVTWWTGTELIGIHQANLFI